MAKFNLKASKKAISREKAKQEKREGGGQVPRMKLSGRTNRVLILPPWKKDSPIFKKVSVHQVWKNKGGVRKPIATATSPAINDGDDDPIMQHGWDLREKYQDSKSKKKQDLWRLFMPTDDAYVNVLDLKEKNPTPRVLKLPQTAFKLLLEELEETEDGSDICDLDEGRAMIIKGNGKNGQQRRYEVAKFERKPVNLVADGIITEEEAEEIENSLYNLDLLQPEVSEKRTKKVLNLLKKAVLASGGAMPEEDDDIEDDEELDDEDIEDTDDEDIDEEEFDEEDEDDEDIDDEDDMEDDDDDMEDDDDDDFEDDDDLEDEDDEEEKPVRRKKKKKTSKKKTRTSKSKRTKGKKRLSKR